MKLIVGLGNPGKQYEKTRHNVGFMVLDSLQKELQKNNCDKWILNKKFNAETCEATVNGNKIILAKPMTFMNASGQSVQLIAHFFKLKHDDIIVIHDEKDLPLGEYKVQTGRGDAGHNGIRSIVEYLGTKDITRYRIGIASKNEKKMEDTSQFVLGKFGLLEKRKLDTLVQEVVREIVSSL
ncbi:MAG: aminoacyl-tRNA hydrolase [Candidatus Magasanikbacteria bacterium]